MPGGRLTVYKPENAEMTRALAWIRARGAAQISREDALAEIVEIPAA
jgi:hypothetical protein